MRLFSVYDKKAQQFGPLVVHHHEAVAIRGILEAMQDERSSLGKYPEDFALYCLGGFEQDAPDLGVTCVEGCKPELVAELLTLAAVHGSKPELVKEA